MLYTISLLFIYFIRSSSCLNAIPYFASPLVSPQLTTSIFFESVILFLFFFFFYAREYY